jgi:hypothetical protein
MYVLLYTQISYIFLLLIIWGFQLSGEIHFPSTLDNQESIVFSSLLKILYCELCFVILLETTFLSQIGRNEVEPSTDC